MSASEEKAKAAISHVLGQIRTHEGIGWFMGVGTQSFTLLTEAAAELWNEPVEKVREHFKPTNPRNPAAEKDAP